MVQATCGFFFFGLEYRMISQPITKCLMSSAPVSSLRVLKITQADGYSSVNNLEPNQCCQLDDSFNGRVLNISIHIFNGQMKNKGKLTPRTTKNDAGVLGSEASSQPVSKFCRQIPCNSEDHIQTSEHKGQFSNTHGIRIFFFLFPSSYS